MSEKKIKVLEEKIKELEAKERGTAKAFKNVQDYQAGIGRSALSFQRWKTYFLAFILGCFGIGYIIYAATSEKNKDNKESDFVIGGVCLFVSIFLLLAFRIYSNFVSNNKNAQIFNAFLVETSGH